MRLALAILAAAFANVLIVFGFETVIHGLFPPPPGTDLSNPAAMATLVETMALPAKLLVLVSWALGALAAALVALVVSRGVRWTAWAAMVLPLSGVAYSLAVIPHPLWMAVIGMAAPPLAALLALQLRRSRAG